MSARPPSAVSRPSLALLGAEPFRAALEFVSHKLARSDDLRPGDGHPVPIFPGLAADGISVAPLREHCVGWLYRALGGSVPEIDVRLSRRLRTPPPLPTTSIDSRSDGVVAWQTCRHQRRIRQVQDIEVDSSHIGMGWNRAVLRIVDDRLLPHTGAWRRYAHAH